MKMMITDYGWRQSFEFGSETKGMELLPDSVTLGKCPALPILSRAMTGNG